MSKRNLLLIFVASSLTVVLICWWVAPSTRTFDAFDWQADSNRGEGPRLEMADNLVATGTLLRKTRSQVVDLLGEPPETEYFTDWDLVYWLGPERGYISIDSEWLVLRLGADGKVTENRIVTD